MTDPSTHEIGTLMIRSDREVILLEMGPPVGFRCVVVGSSVWWELGLTIHNLDYAIYTELQTPEEWV